MNNKHEYQSFIGSILKSVSRSFYLSMRVLPHGMREDVSLAYLLARAADTLADSPTIEIERRLQLIQTFQTQTGSAICKALAPAIN
ncbi:MAG: squalene/phytoene synthase family protein, partial [Gammaproteobacteria bacterium]|nr:squalene/phytoene synthase family protein [Gammaproteobacteria bacterium]